MISEGTVSDNDIVDMAGYNCNLFSYTMLHLPFDQFSPQQEAILDSFYDPAKHYKELLEICGRKSAKSLRSAAILLFEAYKLMVHFDDPHDYYGIPRKKGIFCQLLAANRDQAKDTNFDYIRSFASTSPYFCDKIKNSTNDELILDKNIHVKVYNSSARSARGESSMIVIMDEIAHWIVDRSNLSAEEIYPAVMPNLKVMKHQGKPADSRSVLLTSPAAKQGLVWELFRTGNQEHVLQPTLEAGENPWRLVWQSETWNMNPKYKFECRTCPHGTDVKHAGCLTCDSMEMKIEWIKSPDRFMQEYGALFVDTCDPALSRLNIDACISDKIHLSLVTEDKQTPRVIALDPGLSGDAYALVMCHMEENVIIVDYVKTWNAIDKDHPIQLRLIQEHVEKLCNLYNVFGIVVDQFQSASTVQALQEKGLPAVCIPATSKSNQTSYERMINRINTQSIRYPPHRTLLNELYFLQRKQIGKTVRYEASIDSTDDITDAMARAVEYIEVNMSRRIMVDKL